MKSTNLAISRAGVYATGKEVTVKNGCVIEGFQHGLKPGGNVTMVVDGSTLKGNSTGLMIDGTGLLGSPTVVLRAVDFVDDGLGIYMVPQAAMPIAFTMTGGQITGGKQDGFVIAGPIKGTAKLRGVKIAGQRYGGILLSAKDDFALDLGTAADPGGNVITGNNTQNLAQRANLAIDVGAGRLVQAVGNTFDPVQGADAMGRYVAVGAGAKIEHASGSGKNFIVTSGTLRLAENP